MWSDQNYHYSNLEPVSSSNTVYSDVVHHQHQHQQHNIDANGIDSSSNTSSFGSMLSKAMRTMSNSQENGSYDQHHSLESNLNTQALTSAYIEDEFASCSNRLAHENSQITMHGGQNYAAVSDFDNNGCWNSSDVIDRRKHERLDRNTSWSSGESESQESSIGGRGEIETMETINDRGKKQSNTNKGLTPPKDSKYLERRRKNNLAAKKSRDARRIRENQLRVKVICLENANQVLRSQVTEEQEANRSLRERLKNYEDVNYR